MSRNEKAIALLLADITGIAADAVVNPANTSMLAGSGLCRKIHKIAGDELRLACEALHKEQSNYKVGSTLITPAGALPARHVVHAVSPKWFGESYDKEERLKVTYENIIKAAEETKSKTIAIPSIATGLHKYPQPLAARIALQTCNKELPRCRFLQTILIICFNITDAKAYSDAIEKINANNIKLNNLFPDFDEAE